MSLAMFDLSGKRALITGAGQGIGLGLARTLAQAGAAVVLNGRDAAKLTRAAEALRGEGFTAETAPFDVADAKAVQDGVAAVTKTGRIDILINNAGLQRRTPLQDFPEADWEAVMRTNLDAVFFVAKAVAQQMIPRRQGKIINICSVMSELARPGIAPYAASKGAVRMLTRGMCADWAPYGLQVNGIAPGYFETEMNRALIDDEAFSGWLTKRTPTGRWGRVEELGGAAVFLASAASSFVNGQVIFVDGGLTAVV